ncbi:hypothetical protein ACFFSH_24625 [Streptomyces filamentosus]|uniref:Uncharacterized protein n=1 Tax=Streptomyces filamentosus TaxID=67294 RepID=A0A919ENH2_STRFL|nr:hypothetical protein [Streptomyces filamentosus]GHG06564.1 hypothetical protein GCM10017667_42260 [Streptomyces filamentosus]
MSPLVHRLPGQVLAAITPRASAPLQVDLFRPKDGPVHDKLARHLRPAPLSDGTEPQQEVQA